MGITVAELTAQIRADGASTAVGQVKQLGITGDETTRKLVEGNAATNRSFKTMVKNAAVVAGSLYAIKKASDVLISSISVAKDFESAVSDLSAITGAVGDDLEFLAKKSREFGASTTLSATQAAEAFKLIASAKPDLLESGEALAAVTKEAITLAEASGSTLPEAAATLGSALNQFNADADESARFINVLAAGAKFGSSEIADTANALRDAGTVAASANISFEELNAGIQALSTNSIKGSRAGVGLRNIILKLQKEGIDALNPSVVGLTKSLQNLAAENLDTTELIKIFGLENVTAAKILLNNANTVGELTKKLTDTNTAYEQARVKQANLTGDTKKLNSAWEEFQLTLIGSTDPLREVVQTTTKGVLLLSSSIDELVIAGEVLAALAAGQLARGLSAYTVTTIKNAAAQRATTLATLENAKATSASLGVKAAYAAAEVKEAQAAVLAATGIQRLSVAQNVLVPAQAKAAAAANIHTAALVRLSAATSAASVAAGGLRTIMALLGGPVGIIITAATALAFWSVTADAAKGPTKDLSDNVGDLAKNLTQFDIAGSIKATRDQIKLYKGAIDSIKETAPGDAGIARIKVFEDLILESKTKLADLGVQLQSLKDKEKEISDIATGEKPAAGEKPPGGLITDDTIERENEALLKSIDNLDLALLSKEDREHESYARRWDMLSNAVSRGLKTQEEADEIETRLFADHQQRLTVIAREGLTARQQFESKSGKEQTKAVFGELASVTQGVAQHNKALFKVNQIAGVANAVIHAHEGASASLAKYPMPLAAVMAGVHYAAGIARVNAIRSTSFGGGASGAAAPSLTGLSGAGTTTGTVPAVLERPEAQRERGKTVIIFQGDMIGWDEHIRERIIGGIKTEIDENDVTIIGANSRQALELRESA